MAIYQGIIYRLKVFFSLKFSNSFDVSIIACLKQLYMYFEFDFFTCPKIKKKHFDGKIIFLFVIFVRLKTPMWLTWLTMQMMVHVQPFKMQTYVCCTTIVRSKYNSNSHRILWAAISLQQKPNVTFICLTLNLQSFLNHSLSPRHKPQKPVVHARSPNTHGQMWLRIRLSLPAWLQY